MDENKEVNSTDPKREKVRVIPLSAIDDAPDHPFGVRDDDEMAELVESISTFGVINPVIVRKGEGERYELISGHRRKFHMRHHRIFHFFRLISPPILQKPFLKIYICLAGSKKSNLLFLPQSLLFTADTLY